ncbi:MAG: hydrogenase maturation nickel metallochaperone HypA [Bacteroidota bacterium]
MHELSIAESIIDIIHQYVATERLCTVRSVTVKVGTFSGVVSDSLEFSYQAIIAGTPLDQSRLSIEQIPFVIECTECSQQSYNEPGMMQCTSCGSVRTKILSGKELQVKDIELDDVVEEQT